MKSKILAVIMAIGLALVGCQSGENSTATQTEASSDTKQSQDQDQGQTDPAEEKEAEETSGETEPSTSNDPVSGGYINLAIQSDPEAMNPFDSIDSSTGPVVNMLFDPLISVLDGEVVYYLAETVEASDDNLTYTVKLRDGLKWHDGEAITADDVIFTVEATMDEDQQSYKRSSLIINDEPIKFEKVDDLTFEVILPEVVASFEYDLARITPIPKHIFEGEASIMQSSKNENPVGSGPFKFADQRSGEYVIVERYDDYYGGPSENGPAYLDGVVFRVLADPQASLIALLNGEIDSLGVEPANLETVEGSDLVDQYIYDSTQVFNLVFKLNNELLVNQDVRKAIAYGINRDELTAGYYGDGPAQASLADSFISIWSPYHSEDVEKYEYNPEKAKEILEEAGYSEGDISLSIGYTPANEKQEMYASIIQQQMAAIGINIELKAIERGAFVEALVDSESTEFDMAMNGYNLGEEPSRYAPLFLSENPNNFMGYENSRVDELFAQGNVETDDEARYDIYEEIQQIIADELPVMTIEYPSAIQCINKRCQGLHEPEKGRFFTDIANVWVTDAEDQSLDAVGTDADPEAVDQTESEDNTEAE